VAPTDVVEKESNLTAKRFWGKRRIDLLWVLAAPGIRNLSHDLEKQFGRVEAEKFEEVKLGTGDGKKGEASNKKSKFPQRHDDRGIPIHLLKLASVRALVERKGSIFTQGGVSCGGLPTEGRITPFLHTCDPSPILPPVKNITLGQTQNSGARMLGKILRHRGGQKGGTGKKIS